MTDYTCFYCGKKIYGSSHNLIVTLKKPIEQDEDESEPKYVNGSEKTISILCCGNCRKHYEKADKQTSLGCAIGIISIFISALLFLFMDIDLGFGESKIIFVFFPILIGITIYYIVKWFYAIKVKFSGESYSGLYLKTYNDHKEIKSHPGMEIVKVEWDEKI